MNKTEAKQAIFELIETAREAFQIGGDQQMDATVLKGHVNFDQLQADIAAIVDAITV